MAPGRDSAGDIDVAVIELHRSALPESVVYRASRLRICIAAGQVEVGTSLLVVGFPLGFHDTLHHMPVVRHAIVASSFGLRFQGKGYFLTDARTHRGTQRSAGGDCATRRQAKAGANCRGRCLASTRKVRHRNGANLELDEALGLNCAWYRPIS